jgi:peptidoglycan/LPS O-acetylase OafA/YrhL
VSGAAAPVRFEGFDAVRGLAAFAVLVVHAVGVYAGGSAADAWVRPWVARLDVAVPVFFLLSGFLLYRPYVRARCSGRDVPSARVFLLRRALRITPAYWVALTFAVAVLSLAGVWTVTGIVRYYGLLQGYDADWVGGGLPQAWTLTVEVAFYLFLPVWALAIRRLAPGVSLAGELRGLALLAAVSVAWKAGALAFVVDPNVTAVDPWLIALPAHADQLALGMALAVLSVGWQERGIPAWAAGRPALWWLAAAGLYAVSAVAAGLDDVGPSGFTHAEFATRHALHAAIAFCVVVPAVAGGGLPSRVLALRPLRRLGTISYSFYLYHLTVLGLLGMWGLARFEDTVHPYVLWLGASFAGTVLLAEISWRLVEAPALALKERAGPRLRPPAVRPARAPRG